MAIKEYYEAQSKAGKGEIEINTFWVICPKCGEYMNEPIFDPNTGKAYHKWCVPNKMEVFNG